MRISRKKFYPCHDRVYEEAKVKGRVAKLLGEFIEVIEEVPDDDLMVLWSKQVGRERWIYSPREINARIRDRLMLRGWDTEISDDDHPEKADFGKDGVVAEVQLGKYAFVCADLLDMAYKYRKGLMDFGILVVPDGHVARNLFTGTPNFDYATRRASKDEVSFPLAILGLDVERVQRQPLAPNVSVLQVRPESRRRVYLS